MTRVYVAGWGMVSPAGRTVAAAAANLREGVHIPTSPLLRPGWSHPLEARPVPPPAVRPAFLAHPRLRRASPISHHALEAALEAMRGGVASSHRTGLGILYCVMCGCVSYSRRFYGEVRQDPGTASPLLFPETVYNSPASHLAAYFGSSALNYTLVGDESVFLLGLATAAQWVADSRVDRCLVVAAEELDWMTADSARHFERRLILSEGAGALLLQSLPGPVELDRVSDPWVYGGEKGKGEAMRRARHEMPAPESGEVLIDSRQGLGRRDEAETRVWKDWSGERSSPKKMLGEAFSAGGAWQCALACDAITAGSRAAAQVSVAGSHFQAMAARFLAVPPLAVSSSALGEATA